MLSQANGGAFKPKTVQVFKQVAAACRKGNKADCMLTLAAVLEYKNSSAGSIERYSKYFYTCDKDPSQQVAEFLGRFDEANRGAELTLPVKNVKYVIKPPLVAHDANAHM